MSNLAYRISRWLERLGWRVAWFFHAAAGIGVGVAVALVRVLLDGAGWGEALMAGALAIVPAAAAGAVALNLAHALARTTRPDDPLGDDDDGLEGVVSRRQFLRQVEREWRRCQRYADDGALLVIDADHLRQVNQSFGPRCGDALVLELTRCVHATLRQSDILGRFGGSELAVFLPHTDPAGAVDAAERIRRHIASMAFMCSSVRVMLTISVGVASVRVGKGSPGELVRAAEQALRHAKDSGRNCVRSAPRQDDLPDGPQTSPALFGDA